MPKGNRKMKRSNSGTFIHEDKTGKRYGKLTVIDYLGNGEWFCLCDCGKSKIARSGHLNAGKAVSCGCMEKELRHYAHFKHGGIHSPLYIVWEGMKQRWTNKNHKSYHNYGGRGIDVCEEWANDYGAFEKWAKAAGYKKGLSIERINNNDGYKPDNCKWTTAREQCRNRRVNKKVYLISESGEILKEYGTISEASEDTGCFANSIGKVCRGKLKSTHGMRWMYAPMK